MLVSLIIPCYNEEESLPYLYKELCSVAEEMNTYEFEFLFINDGSRDDTLKRLKEFSKEDNRVVYLSFSRNFGKESAMYAGFCNAKGDYVSVMDADMQDPPSLLPKMMELLESGEYDSVATRRMNRKGEPLLRSLFAKMFYRIINKISDADVVDGARDFRLMKRQMVDAIVEMSECNRFSKGIFGWIGFRTYWLSYENVGRVAGKTKWSFRKLFNYALEGIVGFSTAPLRISVYLGSFTALAAIIYLIAVVIEKLAYGIDVPGYATIIVLILLLGSMQLFCLGIIGEYVGKIFEQSKDRPIYIAKEIIDHE